MSNEVCVHCGRRIVFRPEFGDYEHAHSGWTFCFEGGPVSALPKRDTPLETVDTQIIKTRAGYFVPSASAPGAFRLVSAGSCTCPAGGGPSCRHRKAVQELVRRENVEFARPVAPVNVSAMVD